MPAIERIIPPRGREFWDALDPDNMEQVLKAVKEQFNRPEPAYELHYHGSMSTGLPTGTSRLCFRDCLVFLLRGAFIIKGQGRLLQTGCAYRIKDEVWLWLCGTTTIVIMEEGEMKGECMRSTRESQALLLAQKEGSRRERKRATKLLDEKFRAITSTSALHRPWKWDPPDVSPQNPRRRSPSFVVRWYTALLTFISPKKH